jgi:hypothetical protein
MFSDAEPLPRGGLLRKGVVYRVPVPRGSVRCEAGPDVLEIVRRIEARKIREYYEKRKRAP